MDLWETWQKVEYIRNLSSRGRVRTGHDLAEAERMLVLAMLWVLPHPTEGDLTGLRYLSGPRIERLLAQVVTDGYVGSALMGHLHGEKIRHFLLPKGVGQAAQYWGVPEEWQVQNDILRACLRSLQYVKLRLLPEGVIMSHSYSSDISREQFARILPCLESARRRTKPRTVDLYDVFCGVLYLLKSGCQWRMLPADFPDWRTCYKYFRQWSERPDPAKYSILEQVLKKIGWRGPAKQWSERTDQLLYRGPPERQEHRQRREQGL